MVSSFTGWGVYGLYIMKHLARDPFFQPLTSQPFADQAIAVDAETAAEIAPLLRESRSFHDQIAGYWGQRLTINHPVLHALGNNLVTLGYSAHQVQLCSDQMVGVAVFEHSQFDDTVRERMNLYRQIVVFSSWNEALLRAQGIEHVVKVFQGVEGSIFHPRPPQKRRFPGFAVFSGGKLEFRKGQDLVLRAFRQFRQRHPDAVLVTAWHSCQDQWAHNLTAAGEIEPIPFRDGRADVTAWAVANGVPAEAIVDLAEMPNYQMAELYQEIDVALFPNRGEGGTNLVAMEAMACGVPAILSANTGHLDVIYPGCCRPLTRQRPVAGADHAGWGESDVEEIVAELERLYHDRAEREAIGQRGAEMMRDFDWKNRICDLRNTLLGAIGV